MMRRILIQSIMKEQTKMLKISNKCKQFQQINVNPKIIFILILLQFLSARRMKVKVPTSPPVLDQNYMNTIYQKIVEKMAVLDQLNADYKVKQEEHFLKTFMNVLEKMGNDLILAQEAYKNVDLQARKDNYCLMLAKELSFFKEQSYSLRELLNSKEKDINQMKAEMGTMESELIFLRQGFEQKVKETMKLKSQILGLKKQIKFLSDPSKNSIFKFTNPQTSRDIELAEAAKKKSLSLANYLEEGSLELKRIGNRLSITNSHSRKKNNSMTLEVKTSRDKQVQSPSHQGLKLDLRPIRKQQASTNSSFRKKLVSQHLNRTALQFYEPTQEF